MNRTGTRKGPLRAFFWGLWCALTRPWRPALFLALIAGAVVLAWRGAVEFEAQSGGSAQHASLEQRVGAAFAASVPPGERPERVWGEALRASLDPSLAQPDLHLARSLAGSLDRIAGREALALSILAETRERDDIEAELRARPDWQRRRRLERALQARLGEARGRGLDPAELVFAGTIVQQRFVRAERLYARTLAGLDAWFVDPGTRRLHLDAMPGWAGRTGGPVTLEGEVTTLIGQACATRPGAALCAGAAQTSAYDPVQLTLAALAAGLEGAGLEGGEGAAIGARLLLAAHSAGGLQPDLAAFIAGAESARRDAAVLAALQPALDATADIQDADPRRTAAFAEAAERGLSAGSARDLAELANEAAELRRHAGTGPALRLLAFVRTPDELATLNEIAAIAGPDTLALFHLRGEAAGRLLQTPAVSPGPASANAGYWIGAAALAGLALFLVLAAQAGARAQAASGVPGGVRQLALRMESLILGKNI